jgi:hypothetical protein
VRACAHARAHALLARVPDWPTFQLRAPGAVRGGSDGALSGQHVQRVQRVHALRRPRAGACRGRSDGEWLWGDPRFVVPLGRWGWKQTMQRHAPRGERPGSVRARGGVGYRAGNAPYTFWRDAVGVVARSLVSVLARGVLKVQAPLLLGGHGVAVPTEVLHPHGYLRVALQYEGNR